MTSRPGPSTAEDSTGSARYVVGEAALLDSGRPLEDPRIDLNAFVQPYLGALIAGLAATVFVLVVAAVSLARRTRPLDEARS